MVGPKASPSPPREVLEAAEPDDAAPEDEFATSDLDDDGVSDASTSLKSSILQHSFENGRRVNIGSPFSPTPSPLPLLPSSPGHMADVSKG